MYEVVKQAIIPTGKYLIGVLGAVLAFLEPTVPFILICTFAVLYDCYTAWALSRRVKKKYPGANDGKFKSNYAGRVFLTLLKTYALIVLAFLIENFIFEGLPVKLSNIIAGAVCFWQIWSMLENESSCNDARWAKIAQRILVDKTERHFDIDLHELKEEQPQPPEIQPRCGNTVCAYRGKVHCDVTKCPSYIEPKNNEDGKH